MPCIAWWPGHVPPRTVTDHLSGFQDWLPILCEIANVAPPASDGISLVPTLTGRFDQQRTHEALYFEFHEGAGSQAVVANRWKAVRPAWRKDPSGPVELYDLPADYGEQRNVAEAHSEVVRALDELMRRSHTPQVRQPPASR